MKKNSKMSKNAEHVDIKRINTIFFSIDLSTDWQKYWSIFGLWLVSQSLAFKLGGTEFPFRQMNLFSVPIYFYFMTNFREIVCSEIELKSAYLWDCSVELAIYFEVRTRERKHIYQSISIECWKIKFWGRIFIQFQNTF